jgi:hypothetical protein
VAHYDVDKILSGAETVPGGLSPSVVRASLRATAASSGGRRMASDRRWI